MLKERRGDREGRWVRIERREPEFAWRKREAEGSLRCDVRDPRARDPEIGREHDMHRALPRKRAIPEAHAAFERALLARCVREGHEKEEREGQKGAEHARHDGMNGAGA